MDSGELFVGASLLVLVCAPLLPIVYSEGQVLADSDGLKGIAAYEFLSGLRH